MSKKRLVKVFKRKKSTIYWFFNFNVLLSGSSKQAITSGEYGKVKRLNQTIERILLAEQKLRSNVSFQAVAEQFVLQTIF